MTTKTPATTGKRRTSKAPAADPKPVKKPAADPKPVKTPEQIAAEKAAAKKARTDALAKAREEKAKEQKRLQKELKPILEGLAGDINARIDVIERGLDKLDDQRLAVSLQLAEAKKACESAGMSFKEWSAKNIKEWTVDTARKLAAIGMTPQSEGGPAKALADLREKNKRNNKALRDRKAAAEKAAKAKPASAPAGNKGPATTPFTAARDALHRLDTAVARSVLESEAQAHGLTMLPTEEYKKLTSGGGRKASLFSGVNAVKEAFTELTSADKVEFLSFIETATNMAIVRREVADAGRKALAMAEKAKA